jgi:hypothetical protein
MPTGSENRLPGSTSAKVAERWPAGKRAFEISDELAGATVTCHVRRVQAKDAGYYIGRRDHRDSRRLWRPGQRALRHPHPVTYRLNAASGAPFRIPDATTEAGTREVHVSRDLLEEIVAHIDRLRRADQPTGLDSYLFFNRRDEE